MTEPEPCRKCGNKPSKFVAKFDHETQISYFCLCDWKPHDPEVKAVERWNGANAQ